MERLKQRSVKMGIHLDGIVWRNSRQSQHHAVDICAGRETIKIERESSQFG
jgi:hypothetical protein